MYLKKIGSRARYTRIKLASCSTLIWRTFKCTWILVRSENSCFGACDLRAWSSSLRAISIIFPRTGLETYSQPLFRREPSSVLVHRVRLSNILVFSTSTSIPTKHPGSGLEYCASVCCHAANCSCSFGSKMPYL